MKKCDGGAGLIDVKIKDMSLKITWVQILATEPELRRIVQINTIPILGDNIWECNLKSEHARHFIKDKFWCEVFGSVVSLQSQK